MSDQPASIDQIEEITPLLTFVLSMIYPLLTAAGLEPRAAFRAAQLAVAAYTGNPLQTGQAAALPMVALDNLRLSAPIEVPLELKLKLRANANALSRTSARHAQPAQPAKPAAAAVDEPATTNKAAVIAELHRMRTRLNSAPPPTDPRRNGELRFAIMMIDAAFERLPELAHLGPEDHEELLRRLVTITNTAGEALLPDDAFDPDAV